jgi:hypothetical protein
VIQTINAVSNAVTVQATPGVANLYLGAISNNVAFNRNRDIVPATDLNFSTIGQLDLLVRLTPPVLPAQTLLDVTTNIEARGYAEGQANNPVTLNFTGPYPQTLEAQASATYVTNLINDLLSSLELRIDANAFSGSPLVPLLGTIGLSVNDVVNNLLTTLRTALDLDLGGVTGLDGLLNGILGNVVDPTLDALGIAIGKMGVTVHGIVQLCPDLTINKSHTGDFTAGTVQLQYQRPEHRNRRHHRRDHGDRHVARWHDLCLAQRLRLESGWLTGSHGDLPA